MPNLAFTGYNQLLSEMSVLYKNHAFVADNIWKPVLVQRATGNYRIWDKTAWNVTNTYRGIRQAAANADFGWTNAAYAVDRHAFSTFVYDDEKDEMEGDVDLSFMAVQWIKDKLLLEQELQCFGPNSPLNSTSATYNGGTAALDLSNLATADWKSAISAAATNIETTAGVSPNVLVTNPEVMRNLVATTQFQNSVIYTLPTIEIGGLILPKNLLGIPCHYVQAIANTAYDGLASVPARIMPNNIWIGYVDPNPTKKYGLTYGCRFWTKDRIITDRSVDPMADKYICEYDYTLKNIATECGYLLTCTLAENY